VQSDTFAERYRIDAEVASGGMATVYRATDLVLRRQVALKVLGGRLASDPDFRERFRREAVSAAALNHPNIAAVFDTGDHEGLPFIVMEYVAGPSLRETLDGEGTLDPPLVASIGADCADALAYAHDQGIIHRDVKPANILFSVSSSPKLVDFGIAKAAFSGGDLTETGNILGTVKYLSPEQVAGEEPDGRSDVYSLGVVLYEAVTGRLPFQKETDLATAMARLESDPPSPRDIDTEVPRPLDTAIMKALSSNRDRRFGTAAEMASTLRGMAPTRPPARSAAPAPPRGRVTSGQPAPSFWRSEGNWVVLVALVVALAAGVVFAFQQLSQRGRPLEALGDLLGRAPAETVEIRTVEVHDTADREENNTRLPLAADGDPTTSWSTQWYTNPEFGGLQDGVGIFVDLGEAAEVSEIEVTSQTEGWSAAIRRSDDGQKWTPPGESEAVGAPNHVFETSGSHRWWMIWITRLGTTAGLGNSELPYSVEIAEIVVR
jgi:hypothetical protein